MRFTLNVRCWKRCKNIIATTWFADRTVFNAILFVTRTGCQWKALDATGICSGSTAHLRFQEWTKAGVFQKLWKAGLLEYDKKKELHGSGKRWLER
jgi:transposase